MVLMQTPPVFLRDLTEMQTAVPGPSLMASEDPRLPLPTAGSPYAYEVLEGPRVPAPPSDHTLSGTCQREKPRRDVQCLLRLVPPGGGLA